MHKLDLELLLNIDIQKGSLSLQWEAKGRDTFPNAYLLHLTMSVKLKGGG